MAILYESSDNLLKLGLGIVENRYLYTLLINLNSLLKIDLVSGNTEIRNFSEVGYDSVARHMLFKFSDYRILLPHACNELIWLGDSYNVISKTIINDIGRPNFNRFYFYNGKIYLLPVFRDDIAIIDLQTKNVTYSHINWEISKVIKGQYFSVMGSVGADQYIYLVCCEPYIIIRYDCEHDCFNFFENEKKYISIGFDGKYIWASKKNKIHKLEKDTLSEILSIDVPVNFKSSDCMPLSTCKVVDDHVLFFSYSANMIVDIDTEFNKCKGLWLADEDKIWKKNEKTGSTYVASDGEIMYCFAPQKNTIVEYNVHTKKQRSIALKFDGKIKSKLINDILSFGHNNHCGLHDFIAMIGG